MERSFSEALKHRRTYYSITNQSPIPDQEIECIVNMTVRHVPSAFNSQSTRVVLLLGVRRAWNLPGHWHLIAEMPFGLPVTKPGEKEFQPLEERVRVFK